MISFLEVNKSNILSRANGQFHIVSHNSCYLSLHLLNVLPYYHPTKDPRVNGVSQDLGVNPAKTAITDPPENLESASGRWKARPLRRS